MKTTLALSAALLLAPILTGMLGGCVMSIEAEVPEIEITQHDLTFPEGLAPEVQALSVTVVAKTGIDDLSFIRDLRVTMTDGGTPGAPIELVSYHRGPDARPTNVLFFPSDSGNALDAVRTESTTFSIEAAGTLPDHDWTVDLTLRFAGRVRYN